MSLITWDNGELIASTKQFIKATQGRLTGKWYWECKVTGDFVSIGIGNLTVTYPVRGKTGYRGYYYSGYKDPENISYALNYKAGDTISILLDLDNYTLIFYKNGVSQGISHTNLNVLGEVFPMFTSEAYVNITVEANFGATPFQYEIPQGYLPYDYKNANWFIKNKYLIQDNDKIKKPTMEGLQEIGDAPITLDMFEQHGTEELSDIIGVVNRDFDMIYKEDLEDMKLFRYKLVGYSDIANLEVRWSNE